MIGQVLLDSHATIGIRYLTMGAGKMPWCLIHGITTQLNSLLTIAAKTKDELTSMLRVARQVGIPS